MAESSVTHIGDSLYGFRVYRRDNVLLTWMHCRLFAGFLLRLPLLLAMKARRR